MPVGRFKEASHVREPPVLAEPVGAEALDELRPGPIEHRPVGDGLGLVFKETVDAEDRAAEAPQFGRLSLPVLFLHAPPTTPRATPCTAASRSRCGRIAPA